MVVLEGEAIYYERGTPVERIVEVPSRPHSLWGIIVPGSIVLVRNICTRIDRFAKENLYQKGKLYKFQFLQNVICTNSSPERAR